jgi:hypothetical protein
MEEGQVSFYLVHHLINVVQQLIIYL